VKMKDIDRAKLLADAAKAIPLFRAGMKERGVNCIQIEAYEHEGENCGVGHGEVLIPKEYAAAIIKMIETKLAADLSALGVT
jgi:isocitrate lyase